MSENGDRSKLPEGWHELALEEVAADGGLFTDGDWVLSADLKTGEDVRLLQLGDVGVGEFSDKSSKWISQERYEELGCTAVLPGDLLISRMADPIARACRVPDLGLTCITAVDVTICRIAREDIDPDYVMHALNSLVVRTQAEREASGTTRKRITRKKLARLLLPMPPYEEQRRLAATIEHYFSLINGSVASVELAEKGAARQLRAVLRNAFEAGSAPMTTIGDVADIVRGVTYKKPDALKEPRAGYVPLLRATNIGRGLNFRDLVYVPTELVRPEQRLQPDDIVIAASSGSLRVVGKAARLDEDWEGTFGAFCAVVRPKSDEIDPRFLSWFMASDQYRQRVSALAAGSNINNLKREHLRDMPLPLPDVVEQRRIVSELEAYFVAYEAGTAPLDTARSKAHTLRTTVLAHAVTGGLPSEIAA